MPSLDLTLPDIAQSVSRPIIFSILKQVFDKTGIPEDTEIQYAGERSIMATPGTSIDDASREAKFQAGRYFFVEVKENYDIGTLQEAQVHSFDNLPVFEDIALKLSLRPIYITTDVEVTLRYRSKSESEVKRWMSEMFLKTSRGRNVLMHKVSYTYPLAYPFLTLIKDCWQLREAVAPYGDRFEDYFTRHATERLTVLANRAGENQILAISETQAQIMGFFDFVGVPEAPTRDRDTGAWEIAFNYKFSYQRPDALFLHYPVSVHNQLLPNRYLDFWGTPETPLETQAYYSKSYNALSIFEGSRVRQAYRPRPTFVKLPAFDDFIPEQIPPGTATIFTALCLLEEDHQTLLDLTDLGDYQLDTALMPFIQSEAPYLAKLFFSFFYVTLFSDGIPMSDDWVEVTPSLVVRSTKPLDPRRVYHVRFALFVDLGLLIQEAFERLGRFPAAAVALLSALNEYLAINPDFLALKDRHQLQAWELTALYRAVAGGARGNNFSPGRGFEGYVKDMYGSWSPERRNPFLPMIDDATLQRYLKSRRYAMMTAMTAGVIVHPRLETPVVGAQA